MTGVYTASAGKDSNNKNSQASVEVGGNVTVNSTKAVDEVLLSVDIPEGYNVEFYDINRNSSYSIVPNGYGGAYLVVPRGGGVQVGVTLTKIETDPEEIRTGVRIIRIHSKVMTIPDLTRAA